MDNPLLSQVQKIPLLSKIPASEIHIKKLSGLSNNNYLLTIPNQQFVLRIPRDVTNIYINRNDESTNIEIATNLGIAPKTIWRNQKGVSLVKYLCHSQNLNKSDLNNLEILTKIGHSLKCLHESSKNFSGELSTAKIKYHLNSYFDSCSQTDQKALQNDYEEAIRLLDCIKNLKEDRALVPSHIDLVVENILFQNQDNKLWFIDWEYSAMASPFWDIAMICNQGNLNITNKWYLVNIVLNNVTDKDMAMLNNYQHIVKSISHCWLKAFTDSA